MLLTLFRKEVAGFFSSLMGYIAMVVFLVVIGLFVWIFPDTNALDYGYATLDALFFYAPWVLLFLIPAITMRSFADELRGGTIELLLTRPLGEFQIVAAKYLAALFLVVFTVLPTLIYYYAVYQLGFPKGNIDSGATIGSYIGLLFLAGAFTSIGIFASSLSRNQAVAFVVAVFLCFIAYNGFDALSRLPMIEGRYDALVQNIGINEHYQSISKGVVDTRDALYFVSFAMIFLLATRLTLESRKW